MQKRAKIEVFGHFIEFGPLDRLHIVYLDSDKQSSHLGHVVSHVMHN